MPSTEFNVLVAAKFNRGLPNRDAFLTSLRGFVEKQFVVRGIGGWKVFEYPIRDAYTAFIPLSHSALVVHSYPEHQAISIAISVYSDEVDYLSIKEALQSFLAQFYASLLAFYPVPLSLLDSETRAIIIEDEEEA